LAFAPGHAWGFNPAIEQGGAHGNDRHADGHHQEQHMRVGGVRRKQLHQAKANHLHRHDVEDVGRVRTLAQPLLWL
jgi:hypothetical protein